MSLGKTNQHRKPRKITTNTTVCLKFWNYFAGRKLQSMVTVEGGAARSTVLQFPKMILCSQLIFPIKLIRCHFLLSTLVLPLPVPVVIWIYLLPPIFSSSPPPLPVKRSFFFQKIHTPMLSHYSLQQHAKFAVILPLGLRPEKDKVVCACSYLLQTPWNWKCYSASSQKDPSEFWALRPQSREANISRSTASDSNILIVWLAKEK